MENLVEYNRKLKGASQNLRSNMTDAERAIWQRIRRKQLKDLQFYRQKPVGEYIVDFYCPKEKLILEIDGGQHYEAGNIEADRARTKYFEKSGFKVLRFTNIDVLKNLDGVLNKIYEEVN